MMTVIDYGMGNLRSVSKALESLGASVRVSGDPADVARAEKLILPGVGAFPAAMRELRERGLVEPLKTALRKGTPYLGICLGLQLLFDESDEGDGAKGLGVIPGRVRRFQMNGHAALKVPHMGWNEVHRGSGTGDQGPGECPLLQGIKDDSYFYFVHSYYVEPADRSVTTLETEYGVRFTSMVWRDAVYATQFHPEKSQTLGLRLLQNFVAL